MLGLHWLDWMVLASYFVFTLFLGLWTMKKVKSSADFFMGGRKFGKVLMVAQAFGVGTHTDQPVTVSGAAYSSGISGIWYQWIYMFSTPFFWIIAPIYRRLRYVTMADFFEQRYGRPVALVYTLIALLYFCMNIGVMLKGTGISVEALTGGAISEITVILGATLLFISYGFAGGIVAAVYTDLIQGILILVLSFMMIPFAIIKAGGMEVFHQDLPDYMFSFVAPEEITVFFITMAILNALVMVVVLPHHMAIGGSGKTEIACRTGWTYGNFLKRFATAGWAFIGVFAALLFPELVGENREMVFGVAAKELLPIGFVGLMLAAMIAAVMSTCDAFMVHASALLTHNLYRPIFRPQADEKHLLIVGRISAILVVAGGLAFAFGFESVIQGVKQTWKITAYMGIAFWAGVIWRKSNRWGTLASIISMSLVGSILGPLWGWTFPQQVSVYLPLGILAMIFVSAITPREPSNKLDAFYLLLDTPVGEEHRLREAGVSILMEGDSVRTHEPSRIAQISGQSPQHDRLLIPDLLRLHRTFSWAAYRTDILGFFAASLVGIFTIYAVYLFSRIGS